MSVETSTHRDSWIAGERRSAAGTIAVEDPAGGGAFATVASASVDDCLSAVDAAAAAAPGWAATSPRERSEVLRAAFELMRAEAGSLGELIVRENGKVRADAASEVAYAAEFLRWFAEEAVRIDGDCRLAPAGDKQIVVVQEPVGVSVLITPWNFPAAMATRKIAPALAAGCTVVLKPAPETPLTAFAIADLLDRAGVPAGVVNVVCPEPPGAAVAAMLSHPAVRALSFTGSTEIGALLLERAAPAVLRCSMELGGNAPFLVLEDADVEVAVEAAMIAKLRNGGAACTAANRIYVHEQVAEPFTAALAQAMAAVRMGDGLAADAQLGPLVSFAERDRLARSVAEAIDRGAVALTGGVTPERSGAFYPATLLAEVAPDDPILEQELFGPVAPVVRVASDDEALRLANATDRGLAGYVCTRDLAKAMRIANALEVGMVAINRGLLSDPAAPFGGVKRSGLGREGAHTGIEEFLETKYVAVDWRTRV